MLFAINAVSAQIEMMYPEFRSFFVYGEVGMSVFVLVSVL